jgi:DNA-binding transcriptional LysR family regulator
MDFDRLRYFCSVARAGSVRGAARALKLSPTALSRAVKRLESELHMPLLVPRGRGITVSDEGKLLLQRSEEIIREVEELKDLLRLRVTESKPLKLGSFDVFGGDFLNLLIKGELADVPITVYDLIPGNLEQALIEGRVDVGITFVPMPYPDLDHQKAASLSLGIFARKGCFQGVRLAELPFVAPTRPYYGTPTRVSGLDGWPDERLARNILYRAPGVGSALQICEAGVAAAYLPRFLVRLHNEKVKDRFQLEELRSPSGLGPQTQAVYLAKRKSSTESDVFKYIGRVLRLLMKD